MTTLGYQHLAKITSHVLQVHFKNKGSKKLMNYQPWWLFIIYMLLIYMYVTSVRSSFFFRQCNTKHLILPLIAESTDESRATLKITLQHL